MMIPVLKNRSEQRKDHVQISGGDDRWLHEMLRIELTNNNVI